MAKKKLPQSDFSKQYGIASRFFFEEGKLIHFEQVELESGNGVVFFKEANDSIRFTEAEREEVLQEAVKREDFQAFALISNSIQGLYLSDGEHHIGVGADGKTASGMVPTELNVKYGLVWGPTFEAVSEKLDELKKADEKTKVDEETV